MESLKLENCIFTVKKGKTDIKGFWVNEGGKVFIDNISLFYPSNVLDFEAQVFNMFNDGEQAVFVKGRRKLLFCFLMVKNKFYA